MGLESEIHQKEFKNPRQKAMVNLIYTYHWLNEKIQTVFTCRDITSQQFNILRILRGAGTPLSTKKIRERMLDRMSDTSRIVDRLVVKKYVVKTVSNTDKRLVDVEITAKGITLLAEMDVFMFQKESILEHFSDEELQHLNNLLDKVRE